MSNLLKIGCCCNCNVKVMDLDQRDPRKRKLENYRENWFKLSDNSLMKVAVCSDCNDLMNKEMADNIMQRHWDTWIQEIENNEIWDNEKKEIAIENHLSKKVIEYNFNHNN